MAEKKLKMFYREILLKHQKETGEKVELQTVCKKYKLTFFTLRKYNEEQVGKQVKFIHDFMKEYNCTFEELVKEI